MANVPWTVKVSKRKATSSTPGSRKRRRASSPPGDNVDTRRQIRQQQTLTQIQWIPSPAVNFDENNLVPLEIKSEPSLRNRAPALKKRDSTLTQMDFFDGREPKSEMSEQELKQITIQALPEASIPQLDGMYESPRKPRPSKSSRPKPSSPRKRKSVSVPGDESQGYLPAQKRSKVETDATPDRSSRRSSRQSSRVPSDPIENFAILKERLVDAVLEYNRPNLEIENSTSIERDAGKIEQDDSSTDAVCLGVVEVHRLSHNGAENIGAPPAPPVRALPMTPQRRRHYIPSSQSPDSLPPSAERKQVTSTRKQQATPKCMVLAELSTNTPTHRTQNVPADSHENKPTTKKRVRKLKLPSNSVRLMRERVEDSQPDVWSVQPTSSPKKGDGQEMLQPIIEKKVLVEEEQLEIPSTSQIHPGAGVTSSPPLPADGGTQESLASLSAIFGTGRKHREDSNDQEIVQAPVNFDVEFRDFVERPRVTPNKETQYVHFLHDSWQAEGIAAIQADDEADFGSPVANDTQFAADISHVPTSPLCTRDAQPPIDPHDTIHISSSVSLEADQMSSQLAPPRLDNRVEYHNSITMIPTKDLSSPPFRPTESAIDPTSLRHPSQVSTQDPSSSPVLLRMPPPAQRLIAPASLPHPSQISTQEPSQQLPQLSSIPSRSPAQTERITIKDSNSMQERLSQLPEYNEDELQLQPEFERSQHFHPDEEGEEEVDDLDPRTPRKTVRFELAPPTSTAVEDQSGIPDSSPSSQHANFTQNGHVTATRIEEMRKQGLIPPGYNPPAYKVRSARELLPAWMFEDDDV